MQADFNNKNEFFSIMKKDRNSSKNLVTTVLNTPAGAFLGNDV